MNTGILMKSSPGVGFPTVCGLKESSHKSASCQSPCTSLEPLNLGCTVTPPVPRILFCSEATNVHHCVFFTDQHDPRNV